MQRAIFPNANSTVYTNYIRTAAAPRLPVPFTSCSCKFIQTPHRRQLLIYLWLLLLFSYIFLLLLFERHMQSTYHQFVLVHTLCKYENNCVRVMNYYAKCAGAKAANLKQVKLLVAGWGLATRVAAVAKCLSSSKSRHHHRQ